MVAQLMPFTVVSCGLSDTGLVRQKNEDVWDEIPERKIYILADGMGGHRSGDVAAHQAVATLKQFLNQALSKLSPENRGLYDVAACIRSGIEEANRVVYTLGKTDDSLRGMGTTLCCVHIHDEGIIYAHVGDSRIYLMRDKNVEQISEDHSLLRELVVAGQIREQNASEFMYKNIITKAIGTEPIVEPSVNVCEAQAKDILLICSDGLSDLLAREDLEAILNKKQSLKKSATELVAEAKKRGGHDNITIVLIQLKTEKEESPAKQ